MLILYFRKNMSGLDLKKIVFSDRSDHFENESSFFVLTSFSDLIQSSPSDSPKLPFFYYIAGNSSFPENEMETIYKNISIHNINHVVKDNIHSLMSFFFFSLRRAWWLGEGGGRRKVIGERLVRECNIIFTH